jgi:glycogen(starch) synthase
MVSINMNILHISSNYPPDIGGPASSVPYLSRELIARGHNAYVLTKDSPGCSPYAVEDGVPVYRSRRVPGNFYNPMVAFTKSLAMGVKARGIIKKHDIQLIHSHDINVSAIAGIIGSKLKKVKKITKFPGDLALETILLREGHGRSLDELLDQGDARVRVLEAFQRKICDRYDRILVPSRYMKDALTKYTGVDPGKIDIVYNGITVYRYPETEIKALRGRLLGRDRYLVINASRMVPWKGLEYLIEAFKAVPREVRLILIGSGPSRKALERKIRGLNVIFLDKVPHWEIQKYLRASDMFVLPSLYEPSALALLDCLATQTPVIATNVGGTPELITHEKTGLLINPREPQAISDSIIRLLGDEGLYNAIKKNQHVELRRHLWDNRIQDYLEVYEKVLAL